MTTSEEPKYDLPTAIRIGAEIRGQTRDGKFCSGGRSCALGAAHEGEMGYGNSWQIYFDLYQMWPELHLSIDDHISLFEAITLLNDESRWTREEIADWLDMVLP